MAKKDHTLLESVDLIGKLYRASPENLANLIASAIQRIRKDPNRDNENAFVYEGVILKAEADLIDQVINEAIPYELQIEVMASTVQAVRENPEMDLSVALQCGLQDWDI
jgi:hypothetical protein